MVKKMRAILSGGGGIAKNPDAYQLFADSVDKRKPVLYIKLASMPEDATESYGRFVVKMAQYGILSSRFCRENDMFSEFDLSEFGGIYCDGGNTFRLLKLLKDCGADKKIVEYLKNGGVYIGASAGAIIGGADIYPIIYMDPNAVMLDDTTGLDLMKGYSTVAHYGDASTDNRNNEWYAAVEKLATRYDKLIALAEENAIVIEDDRIYNIGAPCKVYENGVARFIGSGENLI